MNVKYDAILGKLREDDFDETKDGIQDAPSDGSLYGRKNAAWAEITSLSVTDIQTNINDGTLAITPKKQKLYASHLLPLASASAYYVEAPTPVQIFIYTAVTGVKVLINTSDMPSGTNAFKYRVRSYFTGSPEYKVVTWSAKAAFLGDTITPSFGTAVLVDQTLVTTNVPATSEWSANVSIGTNTTDNTAIIQLDRKADDGDDTMDLEAKLVWVEIEFVTV